jgi:hypothetical protein
MVVVIIVADLLSKECCKELVTSVYLTLEFMYEVVWKYTEK